MNSRGSFTCLTKALAEGTPPDFQEENHSLIHSRREKGAFEAFDVWVDHAAGRTIALVQFGSTLCGHKGITHGGATAAVCDELFGWTAHRCGPGQPTNIFTANLRVDYKAPLPAGVPVVVCTTLDRVERRKLFMRSTVESLDGSTLFATAESLFIIARPA